MDKLLRLANDLASIPPALRNDCQALIQMIRSLANPEVSVIDAVNYLGSALAGGDVLGQIWNRVTGQNPEPRVAFGNNGFQDNFRDQVSPNQVRHFIGALMAGMALGTDKGLEVMNGRETTGSLDINLNNIAVPLGGGLQEHNSRYGHHSTQYHAERINKLADDVRDKVCAPSS